MKLGSVQSILLYLLASMLFVASGCSETTKDAPELPEIVFPVSFPFIEDSKLYSIENNRFYGLPAEEDPDASTFGTHRELLLGITSGIFITLDTDLSVKSSEGGVETFSNTSLPEYVAYADKHTLKLYDLNTRYIHTLYSFETDAFNKDAKPGYICDLQKVVTWDEESRLSKKVLFKDELAVYVKTSSLANCDEAEEGYKYWQINIAETSDIFKRRIKTLKTHTHEHKHFHNHDDTDYEFFDIHNHLHVLEEGELDEDGFPFNPNNHKHKHSHTHEFIYDNEHEHAEISQDELDTVHNDPKNQEIKIQTFPILTGRRTTLTSLDEALMYSGQPVIDINARNFGYLGLNTKEQAFKFYEVDLDTLDKKLLWSQQSDALAGITNYTGKNTDWHALVSKHNRRKNTSIINNKAITFVDNKLFMFSLESLFDDDAVEDRQFSFANPLFTSTYSSPYLSERSHLNSSNNKMVISENNEIWLIDFEKSNPLATRIRSFNNADLSSLGSIMMGSEILVVKRFNENDAPQTSITALAESGLELFTITTRTSDHVNVHYLNNNSLINIVSADPSMDISAKLLISNLGSPLSTLNETFWIPRGTDYRNFPEKEVISLLSSDNLSTQAGALDQPGIYILDTETTDGRGETVGTIPEAVRGPSELVLFNNFYNIVEFYNSDSELVGLPLINEY